MLNLFYSAICLKQASFLFSRFPTTVSFVCYVFFSCHHHLSALEQSILKTTRTSLVSIRIFSPISYLRLAKHMQMSARMTKPWELVDNRGISLLTLGLQLILVTGTECLFDLTALYTAKRGALPADILRTCSVPRGSNTEPLRRTYQVVCWFLFV